MKATIFGPPQRIGTHYDAMIWYDGQYQHPDGSCADPERCDCTCRHCMRVWIFAGKPGARKGE